MAIITGPTVTQSYNLGPVVEILPPTYRFTGDDWDDEKAFVFTFYTVLPTFGPPTLDPETGAVITPGPVLTPGTVRDLTGCTFSGTIAYVPRTVAQFPIRTAVPGPPIPLIGSINQPNGQGILTLPMAVTSTISRQDSSVWANAVAGDTSGALATLQARLTDSLGKTATKGLIPLYVF